MTRDEIIKMAGQVDPVTRMLLDKGHAQGMEHETFVWFLERFAALVRAAEQDRCCGIIFGMAGSDNVAQRTVDAIRRKE